MCQTWAGRGFWDKGATPWPLGARRGCPPLGVVVLELLGIPTLAVVAGFTRVGSLARGPDEELPEVRVMVTPAPARREVIEDSSRVTISCSSSDPRTITLSWLLWFVATKRKSVIGNLKIFPLTSSSLPPMMLLLSGHQKNLKWSPSSFWLNRNRVVIKMFVNQQYCRIESSHAFSTRKLEVYYWGSISRVKSKILFWKCDSKGKKGKRWNARPLYSSPLQANNWRKETAMLH